MVFSWKVAEGLDQLCCCQAPIMSQTWRRRVVVQLVGKLLRSYFLALLISPPHIFPGMCAVSQFISIRRSHSSVPDRFLFLDVVALKRCTETPNGTQRADHPLDRRFPALGAEVPLALWMSCCSLPKTMVCSGCTLVHSCSSVAGCSLMLLTSNGLLEAEARYQIAKTRISEDKAGACRFPRG